MDEAIDAPPDERDDEGTADAPVHSVQSGSVFIPTAGTSANSFLEALVDQYVTSEFENPAVNMEIDLVRIQEGMFSPVIILNNLNNLPDVMEPTENIPPSRSNAVDEEEEPVRPVPVSSAEARRPLGDSDSAEQSVELPVRSSNSTSPVSTPRRKKRKRTITPRKVVIVPYPPKPDEDEEGLICSICLDEWTMTGDHRVVSLKCGHLFGMSCIKRWLQDNPVVSRSCATCKSRAKLADIRFIYGRAVKALDNTRETELLEELDSEKKKVMELNLKLSVTCAELAEMRRQVDKFKTKMETMNHRDMIQESKELIRRYNYQLSLEKNIEISREPGCRAIVYANKHKTLLISQKSTQPLFPGYALRLLQVPEICGNSASGVIHVSAKSVRDIALDSTDDLFACATMEKTVKVFSLLTRTVQCAITPSTDAILWSCAFDRERPKIIYLGSQRGTVYSYDIREPNRMLHEFMVGHDQRDYTAVIKICPVEPTSCIPCGGFLVCKLKSAWFYEYTPSEEILSFQLNISGPFSSMSYNADSGLVLIVVRPTPDAPTTLVLATLEREEGMVSLHMLHTYDGSRVQTTMQRSAQVFLNNTDTLVASYLEDSRMLSTWCTNSGTCWVQQLPLGETVMDICPIRGTPGITFLAALSDCRCRIYRVDAQ